MNRRSLLLIGLGFPLAILGAGATWLWTGLTAQPMPLTEIPAGANRDDRQQTLYQQRFPVWHDVHRQLRSNRSAPVRLSASQVQTALTPDIASINDVGSGKQSRPVLQAIAVQLNTDRLTSATRLNLANISAAEMHGTQRVGLLRLFKGIPGLAQQSIFVAIEGRPVLTRAMEGQSLRKN